MSLQVIPPSPMALGDVNIAVSAAVGFLTPLSSQLDLAIFGPFGIGSIQADLAAQFNAALSVNASLTLTISNPIVSFQQTLAALLQQVAALEVAMSLGVPTMSVDIGAKIAANAALAGSLSAKLGGISALIEGALQVKLGALQFTGELAASLSAGGAAVDVLAFGYDAPITAAQVGAEAQALFQALPGIQPTDQVSGIMLVTKSPATATAIASLFKIS